MAELIVDGKNVLQPVNLENNKNEIKRQRGSVPSQVSLNHFKENVGFFRANVKGDDVNELVTQIQNCFTTINERDTQLYDELDTIFHVIEDIHKGSIEGIIVGIKSAQEAIEQSDYAIEQIKETLLILQNFKKQLEENTEHLNDIDDIWDAAQLLEKDLSSLESVVRRKNSEYDKDIKNLIKFRTGIEKRKHIKDVDTMWDDIVKLGIICTNIENDLNDKCRKMEESITKLSDFLSDLESMSHLKDVDAMFQDINEIRSAAEKNAEINSKARSELERSISDLVNKITNLAESTNKNFVAIEKQTKQFDFAKEIYEERMDTIESYQRELQECKHLLEVDEEWDYSHSLETKIDVTEKRIQEIDNVQTEVANLKNQLKLSYYLIGGSLVLLVLQLILNVSGVI